MSISGLGSSSPVTQNLLVGSQTQTAATPAAASTTNGSAVVTAFDILGVPLVGGSLGLPTSGAPGDSEALLAEIELKLQKTVADTTNNAYETRAQKLAQAFQQIQAAMAQFAAAGLAVTTDALAYTADQNTVAADLAPAASAYAKLLGSAAPAMPTLADAMNQTGSANTFTQSVNTTIQGASNIPAGSDYGGYLAAKSKYESANNQVGNDQQTVDNYNHYVDATGFKNASDFNTSVVSPAQQAVTAFNSYNASYNPNDPIVSGNSTYFNGNTKLVDLSTKLNSGNSSDPNSIAGMQKFDGTLSDKTKPTKADYEKYVLGPLSTLATDLQTLADGLKKGFVPTGLPNLKMSDFKNTNSVGNGGPTAGLGDIQDTYNKFSAAQSSYNGLSSSDIASHKASLVSAEQAFIPYLDQTGSTTFIDHHPQSGSAVTYTFDAAAVSGSTPAATGIISSDVNAIQSLTGAINNAANDANTKANDITTQQATLKSTSTTVSQLLLAVAAVVASTSNVLSETASNQQQQSSEQSRKFDEENRVRRAFENNQTTVDQSNQLQLGGEGHAQLRQVAGALGSAPIQTALGLASDLTETLSALADLTSQPTAATSTDTYQTGSNRLRLTL